MSTAAPLPSTPRPTASPAPPARAAERPLDQVRLSAQPRADEQGPPQGLDTYVPGQLLVKFAGRLSAHQVERVASRLGLAPMRRFEVPPTMEAAFGGTLYQMSIRAGVSVEQAIERLQREPEVAYAEPNYRVQVDDPQAPAAPPDQATAAREPLEAQAPERLPGGAATTAPTEPAPPGARPDDLDTRLWGLSNQGQQGGTPGVDIHAVEAWATTTGARAGHGPLICVIDSGVDYRHPDLAANMWVNPREVAGDGIDNDGNGLVDDVHGADLQARTGDPSDGLGHGTHCAGTIAAVGNNAIGVVGVNWNATVAGARFMDDNGGGSYAVAVQAVLYAGAIGARITSSSWGGTAYSQALYDAYKASPALHVCAAGNNGEDADRAPLYPAAFDLDNVVSVAAIDRHGHLAGFSNYGATSVDLAAPGVDILSLAPGGHYETMSGTSMATPHVTGVAGLILARFPELTNEQLKARLLASVTPEDELAGKVASGGRVNAAAALEDDFEAPAALRGVEVVEAGATGLTLGFVAPGDDGERGRATRYEVRLSRSPIADHAAWEAATPVVGLPQPSPGGTLERLRLPIPPQERPELWHVALRAVDSVGNTSPVATAAATTRPVGVMFSDSFESGGGAWQATGTWGIAQDPERGGVFQDSPGTDMPPNASGTLTSPAIHLGLQHPCLQLAARYITEPHADYAYVQISEDGEHWETLRSFTGYHDWETYTIDLAAWQGKTVRIRFSAESDASAGFDGISIDDVRVVGEPAG